MSVPSSLITAANSIRRNVIPANNVSTVLQQRTVGPTRVTAPVAATSSPSSSVSTTVLDRYTIGGNSDEINKTLSKYGHIGASDELNSVAINKKLAGAEGTGMNYKTAREQAKYTPAIFHANLISDLAKGARRLDIRNKQEFFNNLDTIYNLGGPTASESMRGDAELYFRGASGVNNKTKRENLNEAAWNFYNDMRKQEGTPFRERTVSPRLRVTQPAK